MKPRSHRLGPSVTRLIAVICAAVCISRGPLSARAAGVVGTGTAASCTDAALNAALARGGLVTFNCGPAPATIDISTGTGTKTIAADTTVDGGGVIIISGGKHVGVFSVTSGVRFTVKNLTIADGNGGGGFGGILNNDGSLIVANTTFMANSALANCSEAGCGGSGGILNCGGSLIITDSTFTGNRVSVYCGGQGACQAGGGGIHNMSSGGSLSVTNTTFTSNETRGYRETSALGATNSTFSVDETIGPPDGRGLLSGGDGGGISNSGTLSVTNSTFSGNRAARSSPGAGAISNDGTLMVTNSTLTGNSTDDGNVIFSTTQAVLNNTIVANNPFGDNCFGNITDGGHNLDDGTSCGFSTANGSLSNTDPEIDPAGLQDNGGPTQTVALCTAVGVPVGCTAASPAIDAGDQSVCAAAPVNNRDQRSFVRPGAGHTTCSIGAYEADATAPEACGGDGDAGGSVTVDEILIMVTMALDNTTVAACEAGDTDHNGLITIDEILSAVNNALNDCAGG